MRKIRIHVKTFLKKSFKTAKDPDQFGHYYYHALEGVGKTFSAVKFILENEHKFDKIFSNREIRLRDPSKLRMYENFFDVVLQNPPNCIILLDDIFDFIDPTKRMPQDFLKFAYKCRRNHRILLTTGQSWLDTPISFRRTVRLVFNVKRWRRIVINDIGDAKNMKYDKDEGEYICPPWGLTIFRQNKIVADAYSTLEGA